jgi:ubiquinone/menaquinone biosynthesis C-methylase UbiE
MTQPRTWHYFAENERRQWQNPEDILKEIGLKAGMCFMDIGCGNGFFTLPAARLVGNAGMVYALDTSTMALDEIEKKARAENLHNVQPAPGKAEDQVLCEQCADIIFYGIVLHDFEDASQVLMNARKMIKRQGLLADLDWKKRKMPLGPPVAVRFDEGQAGRLIETAGFKIISTRDWGQYNYLMIASPGEDHQVN